MTLLNLSIQDQYDYIRTNIGIIERDDVGCLEISGEDALDLLNRLSTNDLINFDYTDDNFSPFLSTVCIQLFSIYIAMERNLDIDQPRNLAKSVTVE